MDPNSLWLLKVSISLQRGAIFQYKAVLSYLPFTYYLQVGFKMAQDRNLGPTWPHLGPILASAWLARRPQEAPQRPPRGPKKPHLRHKNEHFVWEGCYFASYLLACNMSPLGRRRGPALRASIRRRPPAVSDHARTYSSELASAEHQGATPFRRPLTKRLTPDPISLERGAIFQHKGHAMLT